MAGLTERHCGLVLVLLSLLLAAEYTLAARRSNNTANSRKIRHRPTKIEQGRPTRPNRYFEGEVETSSEKRLTKYLARRYSQVGRGGRPVTNSSDVVLVRFGLAMIQMDLNERQNMLTTSDWCRYRWQDSYLTWDPEDYDGIRSVRMNSHHIWIPDIMLYNTAHTQKLERDVLAVVSHTGEVQWIPHRTYKASCAVDVTSFPFDIQECHMTFGSWAYHGNEIDLGFLTDMEMLDVSDLERESTAWDIIDKRETRKASFYDCCTDPYVTLTFSLKLKRKLVFSSFILTLPCIFLACMTLVVFWLPPERPDRTSLAMSLFASFLLLLLILVEATPSAASSIPTLGVYYCFNMVVIMLSIFLSSVVINISRRGLALVPVPNWLQSRAVRRLSRMLGVGLQKPARPRAVLRTLIRQGLEENENIFVNEELLIPLRKNLQENGIMGATRADGPSDSGDAGNPANSEGVSPQLIYDTHIIHMLVNHFFKMERCLRSIELHLKEVMTSVKLRDVTKEMRDIKLEWQLVATTLDRIFFILFVIAIVVSLIMLFPRPYELTW